LHEIRDIEFSRQQKEITFDLNTKQLHHAPILLLFFNIIFFHRKASMYNYPPLS